MWPSSGDGENVAFGGGGVHAALCHIAADSRELEKVEEVEKSAELEAAAEAVGSRRREEPHAAVREAGEQKRDGQRAVAQPLHTPERLALFVVVGLVELRARRQALHETLRAERSADACADATH